MLIENSGFEVIRDSSIITMLLDLLGVGTGLSCSAMARHCFARVIQLWPPIKRLLLYNATWINWGKCGAMQRWNRPHAICSPVLCTGYTAVVPQCCFAAP